MDKAAVQLTAETFAAYPNEKKFFVNVIGQCFKEPAEGLVEVTKKQNAEALAAIEKAEKEEAKAAADLAAKVDKEAADAAKQEAKEQKETNQE